MKSIARSRRPVLLRLGIIRRGSLACKCEKLVITLRGKAPFIVDVEIPAALYNEEELKRAIEAALARREGASRSLELPKAMKDSRVSFGG